MKKWFGDFLDKLSDANKKEFGDRPLDCCELNRDFKDTEKGQDSYKTVQDYK